MLHQGVWESHMQGEGKQGNDKLKGKGREMRKDLNRVGCRELESRIPGNSSVRFGKGGLETCQRSKYGIGECSLGYRSRQPF
jgi:hypothetical protein